VTLASDPDLSDKLVDRRINKQLDRWLTPACLAAALGFWLWETRTIRLDAIDSSGLISVVGWQFLLALAFIAISASYELTRQQVRHTSMTFITIILIVVLFGLVNVADGEASLTTGWLHVGFSEYINEHGSIIKHFDARFSWPGFFAGAAVVARMAGWRNPAPLMLLAPIVFNVAAILPIYVVARRICRNTALAWLGVLFYFCGDWYEQDYFAPQAVAFLMFITVIAVLLVIEHKPAHGVEQSGESELARRTFFWRTARPLTPAARFSQTSAVALESALLLVILAVVLTHQLTPVALVVLLLALTVSGGTRFRGLWLLCLSTFLVWFAYGARDYWSGHLDVITGSFGHVGSTLYSSVGQRATAGNATYLRMQDLRIAVSVIFCVGGLLGLWSIRRRRESWMWAIVAFSSFSLILLQSYGGEVVIRSMVFAMPFLAPLSASALKRLLSARYIVSASFAFVVLLAGELLLTATRGANAGFERVPGDVVEANQLLDSKVRPGDTIGSLQYFAVLASQDISTVTALPNTPPVFPILRAEIFDTGSCATDPAPCILRAKPKYVVVSSTEDVYGVLKLGQHPAWTRGVVDRLVTSGRYKLILDKKNASLMQIISN
jgi:hypothetical protein